MESDLSNPAAVAYWDNVDETALEATIRPAAVFADVQIEGTLSGGGQAEPAPVVTTAAPAPADRLGMNWIALFALAVLAIGLLASLDRKG